MAEQAVELRGAASVGCLVCGASCTGPRCSACGATSAPGSFRVDGLIAQSVHGRLYRARDTAGRTVALKELVFALAPDAHTIDAFEREARLLAELEHPAIPRFFASFREGQGADLRLYLSQEFVEGPTLLARIQQRRLDESEARELAEHVLRVLRFLHTRKPRLLHRDIKPANLIIRSDGTIALVDFGAAKATERGATHGATVVGTFGYAPVEQFGGTADERSDLYALGATLIHGVTGIPPSELLTASFTIDFARHAPVSKQFQRFLSCLTAARGDRPASAQAALDLLHEKTALPRPRAFESLTRTRQQPSVPLVLVGRIALVLAVSIVGAGLVDLFITGRWTHPGLSASIFSVLRPEPSPPSRVDYVDVRSKDRKSLFLPRVRPPSFVR